MTKIYKGFLKGTYKRAAESFKGDDTKLIIYSAARLLLKIADSLKISCAVLKTTKVLHAYFKGYDLTKNNIEWYSPIGIKVTTELA